MAQRDDEISRSEAIYRLLDEALTAAAAGRAERRSENGLE
jgi:hypothetical protein